MKLLLTSAGITNPSIASALVALAGKGAAETKIGFIPTAANVEQGDKAWFITQLSDLQKYGFVSMDIIDISADGVDWRKRLDVVDVIVVSGGNTFYLLEQARKTGFGAWLPSALPGKVYVGMSAGSIVMTPTIEVAALPPPDENISELTDLRGLSFVDFELSPHVPETISHESCERYAKTLSHPLYALDNNSAIQVVDGVIEVISEGKWAKYAGSD